MQNSTLAPQKVHYSEDKINFATVTISNEDHTLGNLVRY